MLERTSKKPRTQPHSQAAPPLQIQLGNSHDLKFKFLSEYAGHSDQVKVFLLVFLSQKLVRVFLSPKDDML